MFVGDLSKLVQNPTAPMHKVAAEHKKEKKKNFEQPLLFNRWMAFKIVSQECSFVHSQPKLLKLFRSAAQDGDKS